MKEFSINGNEVAFGTIGNASTAEGMFYETINAAGVLMVPMAVSIWDDGFGISVPNVFQVTKSSISDVLSGFEYQEELHQGFLIYRIPGWDYENLIKITEMTQPLGHSTSGSHERYKTKERLQWEIDFDCIRQMRTWMIEKNIATEDELNKIEDEAKIYVKNMQQEAWREFLAPLKKEREEVSRIFVEMTSTSNAADKIKDINNLMLRN